MIAAMLAKLSAYGKDISLLLEQWGLSKWNLVGKTALTPFI